MRCRSIPMNITPSGRKPDSRFTRLRRLRANNKAPTNSTSDSPTCPTTITRRTPNLCRSSVMPRPVAFMAAPGPTRVPRNAGVSPNTKHVTATSPAVYSRIRQSVCSDNASRLVPELRKRIRKRLNDWASTSPRPAPITDTKILSVNIWRTSRPRDAPIASRIEISRCLALARASIRFAMFAQAISRTRPVVTSRIQSGVSYCVRKPDTPVPRVWAVIFRCLYRSMSLGVYLGSIVSSKIPPEMPLTSAAA